MDDGGDVLDQNHTRAQDLRGTCHPQVEAILGIFASCVVVETAVALAWRTTNQNVQFAHGASDGEFFRGELASEVAVEQRLDRRHLGLRRGKVRLERPDRCSFEVHGQAYVNGEVVRLRRLGDTEGQAATSGEQINQRERPCSAFERGPFPATEWVHRRQRTSLLTPLEVGPVQPPSVLERANTLRDTLES